MKLAVKGFKLIRKSSLLNIFIGIFFQALLQELLSLLLCKEIQVECIQKDGS